MNLIKTHRNKSRIENFKRRHNELLAAGIKSYTIVSSGDERVCQTCRSQHGQTYPMRKYKPGVTAPPFCDDCRCIIRTAEYSVPGMPAIPVKIVDWDAIYKRCQDIKKTTKAK